MGVLNVTPDSFSDGGDFTDPKKCVTAAQEFLENGAQYVDIGAESTRPGADFLSVHDEWNRLEKPLLSLIKHIGSKVISVDTNKPEIIERVLDLNVGMINNIKGVELEENILQKIALSKTKYIAMHLYKSPSNMQETPLSGAAGFKIVKDYLSNARKRLKHVRFDEDQFYLDPGIGFGKDDPLNWSMLYRINEFAELGSLCVGISRKSFLGRYLNIPIAKDRDPASKLLEFSLATLGVAMIRTHDVKNLTKLCEMLILKD